jgi:serralysin
MRSTSYRQIRQPAADYWGGFAGDPALHFRATTAKFTTAFQQDYVGDFKTTLGPQALALPGTDDVPDQITTDNPEIIVGAPSIISTINTVGDQDFYKVTLTGGVTYDIGMYLKTGGPSGTPLPDSYIEVYDADGNYVVDADGNGPNTPEGLDALLAFTPSESGVYYINARAFDQDNTNGDTGDGVGDYELFVNLTPADAYHPYYDPRSPLYAIDWGTQVDKINHTVRNPDGNEGTRDTGNPQGTPTYGNGLDIPALAQAQGVNITGKNVITVYFAKAGDVFVSNDPTNPGLPPATITAVDVQGFERTAVITALAEFSKVADVVYLEVQDRAQADFIYTSYQGTPGPGVSLLGSMSPPGESDEGLAQFNSGDERWNARDLAQGGFSFVTLIHEFGHGHGLAHPHDNGGHSGIMHGVEEEGPVADYTTGDYALNQGVFTMMSYEDGWQSSPYDNAETDVGYGYLGGLMAFDIAAIQDKYGVNEEWATGNDVYTMKDVNAPGTYFTSIWDGGGTDEIKYVGARDTTIDLREATLQYEVGGGGFMSYAYGIFGGFTIAHGVTIENATTDAGKDVLFDNGANNILSSGAGNDALLAFNGGVDTTNGGDGNDFIYFGATLGAGDVVDGGTGNDTLALLGSYSMTFGASQLAGIERLVMYSGALAGAAHNSYNLTTIDSNVAAGTQLTVIAQTLLADEQLLFNGAAETNGRFWIKSGAGNDTLVGGQQDDTFTGGAGDDVIYGLAGNDWIYGGLGADDLRGGGGIDRYIYQSALDSTSTSLDHILDFQTAVDRIDLRSIDANGNAGDGDTAFTFIGDSAFHNVAGELRVFENEGTWFVQGDVNGDGTADLVIEVSMVAGQPLLGSDIAF